MKCLYFLLKISIFIKNNPFFVVRQVKFLKFIVSIYLVINLMLHCSTYIYILSCLLIKPARIFPFFFCLEN